MQYQIITTDAQLKTFCENASKQRAIAVDTEFVRTRTLYPQLGLIQLYDGEQLVLVDPLEIEDMSSLAQLLTNKSVIKILHSCSEDLETFLTALDVIPEPVFDTQVAACMLDMGATLGYAKLVEMMLEIKLDKGESRTDWLARPLTQQQCDYAANDVLYLFQLFPQLEKKIEQLGRTSWVFDDMKLLGMKKQACLPVELSYLGIKNNWQLNGVGLLILKELASWRVQEARKKNITLNFILREQTLIEISKKQPDSKNALFSLPGITPKELRLHSDNILNIVKRAKETPPEHYPKRVERLVNFPSYKKTVQSIRQLCQEKANELSIPLEFVGSKKQINHYLKWCWFELNEISASGLEPDLISTWRGPLLLEGLQEITGITH